MDTVQSRSKAGAEVDTEQSYTGLHNTVRGLLQKSARYSQCFCEMSLSVVHIVFCYQRSISLWFLGCLPISPNPTSPNAIY